MTNELNGGGSWSAGSKQNILRGAAGNSNSGGAIVAASATTAGLELARIPAEVRASATPGAREYDARRLRSQMEIIRDVMLSAADCDSWLTLEELRKLTRFGEASISAQLRHLRKEENGGFEVVKRHRDGVLPERAGADRRGECVWEYRLGHGGARLPMQTVGSESVPGEMVLAESLWGFGDARGLGMVLVSSTIEPRSLLVTPEALQGLKPLFFQALNVAAEAATHKECFING
jgi:hypothetical protein